MYNSGRQGRTTMNGTAYKLNDVASADGTWKLALLLFFFTSVVESLGMSHVFAFLPVYLHGFGIIHVALWVGILNACTFIVGLPLVPLWGIWAQRVGGKVIVIRSAIVEAAVLALLAFSKSVPEVVIAMLLVGFQLGNTGIMLAALRNRVPSTKIGFAISMFSVSSPVGAALGPLAGGFLVGHTGLTLSGLYGIDAGLSLVTAVSLALGYREKPPARDNRQIESAWVSAWKSVHFTFSLRITWGLFGLYTLLMIARQMVNPFLPIAIARFHISAAQLTTTIGVLLGLSALVGAVVTVFAGKLGDRVGFTRVLIAGFAVCALATAWLPQSLHILSFSVALTAYSAATSICGAMVFALLSTQLPDSHRTTALNLVYLPLYVGGILGPAISSGLSKAGLTAQYTSAAAVFAVAFALLTIWHVRHRKSLRHPSTAREM